MNIDKMIGLLFCLPSSVLFLKTPKIQGMSSPCNGNHFSSYIINLMCFYIMALFTTSSRLTVHRCNEGHL